MKKNVKITKSHFSYPFITFTLKVGKEPIVEMICERQKDKLLLGDIREVFYRDKSINKGYGTILLKELFEYANKKHISNIYGHLSLVDYDHKDRLIYFYEKHGFEITYYEEIRNKVFFAEINKNAPF